MCGTKTPVRSSSCEKEGALEMSKQEANDKTDTLGGHAPLSSSKVCVVATSLCTYIDRQADRDRLGVFGA